MANKIILKKSAVGGKAPLTSDLDYGELAVNYADGKLYYKNSSNSIDSIPSATAIATLTNKTISAGTLSGNTTVTGDFVVSNNIGGAGSEEGGEIKLATPQSNSTLAAGTISIDVYQNKVRIFETEGNHRGVYIDLTTTSANAGTNLVSGGGVTGNLIVGTRATPVSVYISGGSFLVGTRAGTNVTVMI